MITVKEKEQSLWRTAHREVGVAGLTAHAFTGQAVDEATRLMYYRARWYDPCAISA